MKQKSGIPILICVLIAAILVGCTIEDWEYTYSHHRVGDGYDGNLDFTLITPGQDIEPRMDQATVVFNDKIWVFGGYNPNARGDRDCYLEDIWYSEDGCTWTNVTMDAPWQGRRGHEVIVFNDMLYLIGGYRVYRENGITYGGAVNDVWRSADGITWEQIKAHSYKTSVTHPGLASALDVRRPDIYDPADDKDWYPRLHHTVTVYDADNDGTDELCLIGGYAKERIPYLTDETNDETRKYFSDFWISDDGITWEQIDPIYLSEDNALIYGKYTAGRASFAHFINNDELYIVGGSSWSNYQGYHEGFVVPHWDRVWKRTLPGTWMVIDSALYDSPTAYEYTERRDHEIVHYDGAYWILPGCKPNSIQWYTRADSIWRVDDSTLMFTRDGSFQTGSPMYGTASYSAEVFTPLTGDFAGEEAIYVMFGDGDGGVRNTTWRIIAKEELR